MKTKIVTLSKPGDVAYLHCPTHGTQSFVAGVNTLVGKEQQLISCPFCRETHPSGEKRVGEGFLDSKGVAYVVDVRGNYRVLSKLTKEQKERIQEANSGKKEKG